MKKIKIVVVGGGPSGMMAAIRAASLGSAVTLLEKNNTLGKKLLLSGKGRCNITNTQELEDFLKRFSKGAEFLRDAFKKFFYPELISFFEERGLKLKIERQLRVFPQTDRSSSVLDVLQKEMEKLGVKILYKSNADRLIIKDNLVKAVHLENGQVIEGNRIILASGGASYSSTGSDGRGINIASLAGHKIVPLRAGLVALDIQENYPKKLEGLTLRNVAVRFSNGKKEVQSETGELLFTSTGISGPLVITLSGQVIDLMEKNKVYAEIDLKPGLTFEQLDNRILREVKINSKKIIQNMLKELLPLRLVKVFIEASAIGPLTKCSQLTQAQRQKIVSLLKKFKVNIKSPRPLEEAMVTRGGVSLKEINPRTMESRIVKGLYFCGEMIDIDADTGGFNLQAAFSTGYLAGENAAS